MSKFPTDEADGKISNALDRIFHEVADTLEKEPSNPNEQGLMHAHLLNIYTRLAVRKLNKFYGTSR